MNLVFGQIPSMFPKQSIWVSTTNGVWSFVITKDSNGFSASVRNRFGISDTIHIGEYATHKTFDVAKAACEAFLQERQT